jgi:hypothetical protein
MPKPKIDWTAHEPVANTNGGSDVYVIGNGSIVLAVDGPHDRHGPDTYWTLSKAEARAIAIALLQAAERA